jgi:hypothetical protein
MLVNVWFGSIFDLMFVKMACVATLSLLLAMLLHDKVRAY